jgi:hypothetical protein
MNRSDRRGPTYATADTPLLVGVTGTSRLNSPAALTFLSA